MEAFEDSRETNTLPPALKLFLLLSAGLTILSFVYTIICRKLNAGLPYTFPFYYVPGDMFLDFWGFQYKFRLWGTPDFFEHYKFGYFTYPAPLAFVYHAFYQFPHRFAGFMLALVGSATCLGVGFVVALRRRGLAMSQSVLLVVSAAVLSYPLIFDFQRGNIEFVIWLAASFGVWCFLTGRTTTAAVLIGLAASMKVYPFILLGLFLPRRKYGDFVVGVGTIAAVTLLSWHGLGPTIAAAAHWNGEQMAVFSKYYVGEVWGLGYDHSFFGLVKFLTLHWHPNYFAWARPYTISVAVLSVALYFARIWWLPISNQVLVLTVLSVTIAPISYDYTLLNLYPAFAMLAVLAVQEQLGLGRVPHLKTYMVLFALVLTPESYVIFHAIRYGAQARAVCMIAILILALKTPLPEMKRTRWISRSRRESDAILEPAANAVG